MFSAYSPSSLGLSGFVDELLESHQRLTVLADDRKKDYMAWAIIQSQKAIQVFTAATECRKEHFHAGILSNDQRFHAIDGLMILFVIEIKQAPQGYLQCPSHSGEVFERQIPFATFDPAEIRRMQVRSLSKLFLSKTCFKAQFANPQA